MRLTVIRVTEPDQQLLTDLEKLYQPQGLDQHQLTQQLTSLTDGTTAWVARFNDRTQAALLLQLNSATDTARVSAMVVRDFNRRRGIGSYLLQQVTAYAQSQGFEQLSMDLAQLPDNEQSGMASFLLQQQFTRQTNSSLWLKKLQN